MTTQSERVAIQQGISPLDGFSGDFARSKPGPLYKAGLVVVAVSMVVLPLIYVGLVALASWSVLFHLKNDTWIVHDASGRGGLLRLAAYLGPAIAGGILVIFMVKPFFAAKVKTPAPIALDPAKESLLFAFVQKICGLVGAPVPCRIDVDCQPNASAHLQRGLWSKDLVLTIGLPLASGLDMREFAGVLAHEFGHFAQGAGMRLTYVIRKINFWFARVVYERDAWDLELDTTARSADWRIAMILHAARGCIWFTRRILGALMHAGHAISCFMLRQMEYDADSYEAKLAGSDAFESTASRLRVMNTATQIAYQEVRESWVSNRLPENLPSLIHHKATSLPADVQHKLSTSAESAKTRWFDTHPSDADRVRAVRRLKAAGVFRFAEPATRLFSDFDQLSKAVTQRQYQSFNLEFTEQNLTSTEEILRESASTAEAAAMVTKYYGQVNISLEQLLLAGPLPPVGDQNPVAEWRAARDATEAMRAEAEVVSAECVEQQKRRSGLISALYLAKARFKIEPEDFGLPAYATSPPAQAVASQRALEATASAITNQLTRLEPFMAALRKRVGFAVCFRLATGNSSSESALEMSECAHLLVAVGAEMPRAHEIGEKVSAFALLAQNRENHPNSAEVDEALSELVAELEPLMAGVQERLRQFRYPFPHARGQLNVAEYARSEKPTENAWQGVYFNATAHVERLFALHYRLIGRILSLGNAAEMSLENAGENAESQIDN